MVASFWSVAARVVRNPSIVLRVATIADGKERWRKALGQDDADYVAAGGTLFLSYDLQNAPHSGKACALDAGDGHELWTQTYDRTGSVAAVAGDADRVYLADPAGLSAWGTVDGKRKWMTPGRDGEQLTRPWLAGGGLLCFGHTIKDASDSIGLRVSLYHIDPTDGAIRWRWQPTGTTILGVGNSDVTSAYAQNMILLVLDDETLVAVNATNGTQQWTIGSRVEGVVTGSGTKFYATTGEGYAQIDAATGSVTEINVGASTGFIECAGNRVYTGSNGKLLAFPID